MPLSSDILAAIRIKNSLVSLVGIENKNQLKVLIQEHPYWIQETIEVYGVDATIEGIKKIYSKSNGNWPGPSFRQIRQEIESYKNQKTTRQ